MTLKNACELLELSYIYNAEQLKRCCLDFICINLQTLIEAKSIDILSDEAMDDLTNSYQDLVKLTNIEFLKILLTGLILKVTRPRNRRIPRYSSAPKAEEMDQIHSLFNSDDDFNVNIDERKALLKLKARVKRSSRQRSESTSSDVIESEEIPIEKLTLNSPQVDDLENKKRSDSRKTMNKPENSGNINEENAELSVKSKLKPIKWGLSTSTIPQPVSLKDIITEEETSIREWTKISKIKPNNVSNNSELSANMKKSPVSIPILKNSRSFRSNSSKSNISIESESSSPKSFAAMAVSPPKPNSNPWKKIENVSPTTTTTTAFLSSYPKIEPISMRDIVRAEQEQLQNLKSLEAKPLHIISIEDKAIEELLNYYKAQDNPDEYIVVERVRIDANKIAAPLWKRHQ